MKQKSKSNEIEINVVFASLLSFVKCKISKKQLDVLKIIDSVDQENNATRLITLISGSLECSTSTSWNMLRSLNKFGLIECGTKENKGKLVRLTQFGRIVIGGENVKKEMSYVSRKLSIT